MNRINQVIDQVFRIDPLKERDIIFLIGNTSKVIEDDFFSIPIRIYNQFIVIGVIVSGEKIAQKIS